MLMVTDVVRGSSRLLLTERGSGDPGGTTLSTHAGWHAAGGRGGVAQKTASARNSQPSGGISMQSIFQALAELEKKR